jgi:glycosyltransferase involved in cell wall biosynthesis
MNLLGVSVVICCHNGAERLPRTLDHLTVQQNTDSIPWEVILVDNASTDGTPCVAQEHWSKASNRQIPFRVTHEPRLGLAYARWRGLQEARYEFVSFIDDDNWVCPEWVNLVAEIMSQHPDVGACGGFNEAVYEIDPPEWFEKFEENCAIGSQGAAQGDVTETRGWLWGAGLTVRKSGWRQLENQKFHFLVMSWEGNKLGIGEDMELCFAFRLAGWRLWYDPRLRIKHYLSKDRFVWNRMRLSYRRFGAIDVGLDPYRCALNSGRKGFKHKLQKKWTWQMVNALIFLLRSGIGFLLSLPFPIKRRDKVLRLEARIGRLIGLVERRKSYDQDTQEVLTLRWARTRMISGIAP